MKHFRMTEKQVRAVPRSEWGMFVVSSVGGSDDVYNYDGDDILDMFHEDERNKGNKNPDLYDILTWDTNDKSGNAHDILVFKDGAIRKLTIA